MARTLLMLASIAVASPAYADDGSNAPPSEPPPQAPPSGNTTTTQPAPIAPRTPATPDIAPTTDGEQIMIYGTLPEPGSTVLSRDEARQLAGGLGDPVMAATALPGFAPLSPSTPYFYLRGAPPGNVEYLVDGVRVPFLFHDAVISSVIQPALVHSVNVFASAVPARFGGSAGGVIELETRPPATALHGEVDLKSYESAALVEGPFASDGTALAAVRVGYPQAIPQLFSSSRPNANYWDYQARTTWALDAHDRLVLFAFGSHDDNEGVQTRLTSDFHRLDLRYQYDLGDRVQLLVAATGGWSAIHALIGDGTGVVDWSYGARAEGKARIANSLELRFGARADRDVYSIASTTTDQTNPSVADATPPPKNLTSFAFVDAKWDLTNCLEVVPGFRVGVLRSVREGASGSSPVAEPTLAVRYRIVPELVSVTTFGLADQLPTLRVGAAPSDAVSVPGFPIGDTTLQHSTQGAQSFELLLPAAVTATAAAFASYTRDASDLPAGELITPKGMQPTDVRANTRSYGLELSLRRTLTAHVGGLLSYTLSKTTDQYPDGITQRSLYDRRHVLNAVVAFDLGSHWRGGVRGYLFTGAPIVGSEAQNGHAVLTGEQGPVFARVDLRAEREWKLGRNRRISLVLELQNATLTSDGEGDPHVWPSIGLEGAF